MRLLSSLSGVGSSGVLKLQIPPLAALGRNDSAVAYSRICLCSATTHIAPARQMQINLPLSSLIRVFVSASLRHI